MKYKGGRIQYFFDFVQKEGLEMKKRSCLSKFKQVLSIGCIAFTLCPFILKSDLESISANGPDNEYSESCNDNGDWIISGLSEPDTTKDLLDLNEGNVEDSEISDWSDLNYHVELDGLEPMEDTRTLVENFKEYPYCAIVSLIKSYPSGKSGQGTGVLIAEDTLLTAAHCVYNQETSEFIKTIAVFPFNDAGWNNPLLTTGAKVIINKNYLTAPDERFDYAIVKLNKPLGFKTSVLQFSSEVNLKQDITIPGFPGTVHGKENDNRKMWESTGTIYKIFEDILALRTYISGGQSGSPVLNNSNEMVGLATHSTTFHHLTYAQYFNENIIKEIDNWMNRTQSVYRLINANTGEQFYSQSGKEVYFLEEQGWNQIKLAWFGSFTGIPVYRLYNPNSGDHHFTVNYNEARALENLGWTNEEIAWRAYTSGENPVFRLYNKYRETGNHIYTASEEEKNRLIMGGWVDEGIAWYGGNSDHESN